MNFARDINERKDDFISAHAVIGSDAAYKYDTPVILLRPPVGVPRGGSMELGISYPLVE